MSGLRSDAVLEFPSINGTRTQHVATMVRFNDDSIAAVQLGFYQRRDVAEIHQRRDADAVLLCDKTEIVCRVMRNGKGLEIDIADAKFLVGFNSHSAAVQRIAAFQALAVSI